MLRDQDMVQLRRSASCVTGSVLVAGAGSTSGDAGTSGAISVSWMTGCGVFPVSAGTPGTGRTSGAGSVDPIEGSTDGQPKHPAARKTTGAQLQPSARRTVAELSCRVEVAVVGTILTGLPKKLAYLWRPSWPVSVPAKTCQLDPRSVDHPGRRHFGLLCDRARVSRGRRVHVRRRRYFGCDLGILDDRVRGVPRFRGHARNRSYFRCRFGRPDRRVHRRVRRSSRRVGWG